MTATTDILRGELERLFELEDMKKLTADLLGFDPDSVGGVGGKGAFARALVDLCAGEDALEALADAIVLSKGAASDGITKLLEGGDGPELAPGRDVAGYRILKKLGVGALGTVYLGERAASSDNGEPAGPRRVALKVVKSALSRDRAAIRRFLTVQRALRRADVPGLAPVAALGVLDDGRAYVATEMVEGQTIAMRVGRIGPMHFNEARPIFASVLKALRDLHDKGIVHGDVKSENVFAVRPARPDGTRGEPEGVLVDGGVDRLVARGRGLLSVSNTAKALDPELARGERPGAASDLYAAGVLFYEMLAGRPPFVGDSPIEVLAQHLTAQAPLPSQYAPKGWVTDVVDDLLTRALAKKPTERWPNAAAFLDALETVARMSRAPGKKVDLDQKAFDAAADALRESPADEDKAVALERLVEPAVAWDRAVAVMKEAVEKTDDADAKKALLFRVARIEDAERGDRDGAEAAYRAILEVDADEEVARAGIEEIKRAKGDSAGLVEILLEKAEREESARERAVILREIAQLYEEKLGEKPSAFVAWVQSLADDPRDDRTAREIERLATTTDQWNEAVGILSEAAQEPEESTDAVALYVLMGRWYGEHLARPDFAIECYQRALELDPASEEAYDGTATLYRKSQSWKELVQLLESRATQSKNPARARDLRAEAAKVVHEQLGDAKRAANVFQQILDDDPAHPKAADALEAIHTEKKDWKELAKLLETRSHAERDAAKAQTLVRIGELFEDRLSDVEKAEVQYNAALAHQPDNLAALKGLERIYARVSKPKEMLSVLERQLEQVATPRQRIALLERIGSIREEEFVDHEQAIEAFQKIVEIEPGHDAANTALERLYRQVQRFDDLALTFDRHARGSTDDARKITLLLSAVRVLMVEVGAPERALGACERILAIEPDHREGLDLMARLQAKTGDAAAAIDATERLADAEKDPEKKAELWLRAGRMLEDKGDKDNAIVRYKRALDAKSDTKEAAQALRAIYAGRGDAHGAVDLLQHELDVTDGSIAKAKLYAEMGELYRDRLEDSEKAKVAFTKAFELDATSTPAARGLAEMAFEREEFALAARFSEPLLARAADLPIDVARNLSVICGDSFAKLGNFEKAQRAYLNAKAFAPDDREVLERVAAVTFDSGEPDEAVELYRDIFKRFGSQLAGHDKGRILYRMGEASRRAGNRKEAIPFLEQAAELLPEAKQPLDALTRLFEEDGNWEYVIRTLRRRMEHAPDEERYDLLVRVGDLLLEKMGDRQKASKAYVSALEIRADDRNLLTKLMAVYSESKDWSRLVEVILRISELVEDPRQLSKYYNTAAAICHQELGRLDEACDYYEQALDNDKSLDKAFDGLVDCLGKKQDYAGLAQAYRRHIERIGEGAPAPKRAALYDAVGEVIRHRLGSASEAVEAYEKAQELDPENRTRAEQLAAIYESDPKRYFSRAVHVHAAILAKSPYRVESYQSLRRLYTEVKRADEAWCVCQTLTALSMAEPDEEAFFKKHRSRSPAAAQDYFNEELWFNHIIHPTQDPLLTGIFAVVTPAVVKARAQALDAFKIKAEDKRDAENDEAAMAQTLHWAAGVAQIHLPDVYYRETDPGGLSFLFTDPPGIGLGKGALAGGPSQALAFVAARHLAYFRPGFYLRHLVPTGSGLRAWLLAAIKLVQPQFPVPGDLRGPVDEHNASLKQHLTGQQKDELTSLVTKLLGQSPSLDMKKWVAAVDLTADRVGFVLGNDLSIALAVVRASPEESAGVNQKDRLKELHLYAVSEEYLQLRQKLGVTIGG